MKICALGAESSINQIQRIREGFVELGHEIVGMHDAELIYCNNPWYDEVIAEKGNLKGKIIFNVLDIPIHLFPHYDLGKLRAQLLYADAVTTISNKVHDDIEQYLQLSSCVVYNPIKDVFPKFHKRKDIGFLGVGRMNDPNKRFWMAFEAATMAGFSPQSITVCGTENPRNGIEYLGVVSDEALNHVYNSSKYVICTGKIEGLCLPLIEGIICGAIPIVCNDNPTAKEILGESIWNEFYKNIEPTTEGICEFVKEMETNKEKRERLLFDLLTLSRLELDNKFNKKQIAQNIIDVYKNL